MARFSRNLKGSLCWPKRSQFQRPEECFALSAGWVQSAIAPARQISTPATLAFDFHDSAMDNPPWMPKEVKFFSRETAVDRSTRVALLKPISTVLEQHVRFQSGTLAAQILISLFRAKCSSEGRGDLLPQYKQHNCFCLRKGTIDGASCHRAFTNGVVAVGTGTSRRSRVASRGGHSRTTRIRGRKLQAS
jgi:hypothetical protein